MEVSAFYLPRRIPHDQLCMQQYGSDCHMVADAVQGVVSTFSKFFAVLADRGQRRGCMGRHGQIVEADDTDVLRDAVPQLLALHNGSVGDKIVAADKSSHSHVQKPGEMLFDALADVIGSSHAGGIGFQTVLLHGFGEGFVSDLHNMRTGRTA